MFQSAAIKLTMYYLGIIMAISLIFSIILYNISTNEVERGLRRGPVTVQVFGPAPGASFDQLREARVDETSTHLRNQLVLFNLATLVIGGGLSYILARRTLEPIEEAMEAQGRFVSDASHELRTPLTAMQTQIEVGMRNPKLKLPEAKELLTSTLEEVGKLRDLSNGLLRLTRGNGRDMPKESVSLPAVVDESIGQLAAAAKVKDIKVVRNVSKLTVLGDRPSIKEVLVILLDNALKYSEPKTMISINAEAAGKQAVITVVDQGQGIKATDLAHIFDRFYRADTSRTKQHVDGYGLGLAIAKQLVEAQGGSIEASSKLGEGSTFVIRLPLVNQLS